MMVYFYYESTPQFKRLLYSGQTYPVAVNDITLTVFRGPFFSVGEDLLPQGLGHVWSEQFVLTEYEPCNFKLPAEIKLIVKQKSLFVNFKY